MRQRTAHLDKTTPMPKRVQAYFYGLSMLTSFLNFLYYPFMSRLLPVDAYGEVQFLVTILFQLSVLFLALNIISILFAIRYSHDAPLLSRKMSALSSFLNLTTTLLTTLLVIGLFFFHDEFHFRDTSPIIVLGLAILSTVPFTIGIGRLQGSNLYMQAGGMSVTGAGLKLLGSVIFVLLGLGTAGAILGIAVGQLLAVAIFSIKRQIKLSELVSLDSRTIHLLRADAALIVASIWVIIVNIIMTADILTAKLLLSPTEAGLYAGVATLAKIAIFVVSPLMWLVIPAATAFTSRRLLVWKQVGLASLFCLILLAAYALGGDWFISLVVGSQYLPMHNMLLPSTLAASFLAIAAMLNVILISRHLYRHTAVQTLLMSLGFILTLIVQPHALTIEIVLLAQTISGGLGVLYYLIVSNAHDEK